MNPDDPIFEMIRRAIEEAERAMDGGGRKHADHDDDYHTPAGYVSHHLQHVENMLLDAMDKAEDVHAYEMPDESEPHHHFVNEMQLRHIDSIVESVSGIVRTMNEYINALTKTDAPSDASEVDDE